MMNDWELHRLAAIERELSTDKALARAFGAPTLRRQRWRGWQRRFYPGGYLLCLFTYMVLTTGREHLPTLAIAGVTGLAVWVFVALRADAVEGALRKSIDQRSDDR